jgi:DNA-binding CsgD family transcriptional regulator
MKSYLKEARAQICADPYSVYQMAGLSSTEQEVLFETYLYSLHNGATVRLAERLHYSQSGIKKIRLKALEKIYLRSAHHAP